MKVSYKQLKVFLAPRVIKLDPAFIVPKLGEFLLYDGFLNFLPLDFPNLDNF